MAKGPIITDEVRLLISEVHIAHPHWRAKDVQHEVNVRMRGKGPRISAIQKQLTTVRKASVSVSKSLEAPWSLGVSADYGIPLEANEAIMKIWKWCTVVGMTLTIREAKWVARLRAIAPDDFLYSWAARYAIREQVCRLLGREEIYTADLDLIIAFPAIKVSWAPHEAEAVWTSFETCDMLSGIPEVTAELDLFDKHAAELDDWDRTTYASMNIPTSNTVERYLCIYPGHGQTLGENADMVYAVWLRLFGSSPKWKNMTFETKNGLAMRLYKEVARKEKEVRDAIEAYQDSMTEDGEWSTSHDITWRSLQWKLPEELLQDVGIPEDYTRWKLVSYESEEATRLHF